MICDVATKNNWEKDRFWIGFRELILADRPFILLILRLDQIGIKQIKNVVFSDGLDGEFEINRLVMLHDSILLIAFRPYSGNIYCASSISEWTQVLDQKSFKF